MNIDDQLRMKKAMEALNSKLTLVLPDLMSSNTKLGERLKNKLEEWQKKLEAIRNDTNLSQSEKDKQQNDLKWEYYLKYLNHFDL